MNTQPNQYRVRVGAMALAVASVMFVLYPALRPFSDETTLQAAAAFAANAWVAAHVFGMLGFIGLTVGMLGLLFSLTGTAASRLAFWAMAASCVGAGLTLTYYGAETYALHVVGRAAVASQSASVLALASQIRNGTPALVIFGTGLFLLAVAGVVAALAIWRSGTLPRWSGVLLGAGLVLYIPQYWGPQPVRVAHGLLIAAGCLWLAAGLWRYRASREAVA